MFSPFPLVGPWIGGGYTPPVTPLPPVPVKYKPVTVTLAAGAVFTIPTECDANEIAPYVQRTPIEGQVYRLSFAWNSRAECWTMDVADATGAPVAGSIPIRNGIPCFPASPQYRLAAFPQMPPGAFIPVPVDHNDADAAQIDLGRRVLLAYITGA
jgi:hypothetical protein